MNRTRKLQLCCPTCRGRRLLPVGRDEVECPTCDAAGVIPVVESTFDRPRRRTLIADTEIRIVDRVG